MYKIKEKSVINLKVNLMLSALRSSAVFFVKIRQKNTLKAYKMFLKI